MTFKNVQKWASVSLKLSCYTVVAVSPPHPATFQLYEEKEKYNIQLYNYNYEIIITTYNASNNKPTKQIQEELAAKPTKTNKKIIKPKTEV